MGLQASSVALDLEKDDAEKTFKDLLGKMPSFPPRRDLNETASPSHHHCSRRSALYTKFADWVKGVFGVPSAEVELSWPTLEDIKRAEKDEQALPKIPPIWEFIKAQRRVVRANKKLIAFERGFISEEGIHGREWYKHLGVAPGKWLGVFLYSLGDEYGIANDRPRVRCNYAARFDGGYHYRQQCYSCAV